MTRKKHTHATKSELHAEEVLLAQASAADAPPPEAAPEVEGEGRLQKLLKSAEKLARKRLGGTRVEQLFDRTRLEKALDAALDRVGLVRKSKLPGARHEAGAEHSSIAAEPQPAE